MTENANDNAPQMSETNIMDTPVLSLWVIRSKDESLLAVYEGDTFRSLYDYCDATWPNLLRTDNIAAMRIR